MYTFGISMIKMSNRMFVCFLVSLSSIVEFTGDQPCVASFRLTDSKASPEHCCGVLGAEHAGPISRTVSCAQRPVLLQAALHPIYATRAPHVCSAMRYASWHLSASRLACTVAPCNLLRCGSALQGDCRYCRSCFVALASSFSVQSFSHSHCLLAKSQRLSLNQWMIVEM